MAKEKEHSVNTKKSVVMTFNKAGHKISDSFTYNNQPLDIVQAFTYLEFMPSGTFSYGTKSLAATMPLFRTIA